MKLFFFFLKSTNRLFIGGHGKKGRRTMCGDFFMVPNDGCEPKSKQLIVHYRLWAGNARNGANNANTNLRERPNRARGKAFERKLCVQSTEHKRSLFFLSSSPLIRTYFVSALRVWNIYDVFGFRSTIESTI